MKKHKIVQRLLESKYITAEEAVVLLANDAFPRIQVIPDFKPINVPSNTDLVPYGTLCSCNPNNGGSGICGCIMGNKMVPANTNFEGVWRTDIVIQ